MSSKDRLLNKTGRLQKNDSSQVKQKIERALFNGFVSPDKLSETDERVLDALNKFVASMEEDSESGDRTDFDRSHENYYYAIADVIETFFRNPSKNEELEKALGNNANRQAFLAKWPALFGLPFYRSEARAIGERIGKFEDPERDSPYFKKIMTTLQDPEVTNYYRNDWLKAIRSGINKAFSNRKGGTGKDIKTRQAILDKYGWLGGFPADYTKDVGAQYETQLAKETFYKKIWPARMQELLANGDISPNTPLLRLQELRNKELNDYLSSLNLPGVNTFNPDVLTQNRLETGGGAVEQQTSEKREPESKILYSGLDADLSAVRAAERIAADRAAGKDVDYPAYTEEIWNRVQELMSEYPEYSNGILQYVRRLAKKYPKYAKDDARLSYIGEKAFKQTPEYDNLRSAAVKAALEEQARKGQRQAVLSNTYVNGKYTPIYWTQDPETGNIIATEAYKPHDNAINPDTGAKYTAQELKDMEPTTRYRPDAQKQLMTFSSEGLPPGTFKLNEDFVRGLDQWLPLLIAPGKGGVVYSPFARENKTDKDVERTNRIMKVLSKHNVKDLIDVNQEGADKDLYNLYKFVRDAGGSIDADTGRIYPAGIVIDNPLKFDQKVERSLDSLSKDELIERVLSELNKAEAVSKIDKNKVRSIDELKSNTSVLNALIINAHREGLIAREKALEEKRKELEAKGMDTAEIDRELEDYKKSEEFLHTAEPLNLDKVNKDLMAKGFDDNFLNEPDAMAGGKYNIGGTLYGRSSKAYNTEARRREIEKNRARVESWGGIDYYAIAQEMLAKARGISDADGARVKAMLDDPKYALTESKMVTDNKGNVKEVKQVRKRGKDGTDWKKFVKDVAQSDVFPDTSDFFSINKTSRYTGDRPDKLPPENKVSEEDVKPTNRQAHKKKVEGKKKKVVEKETIQPSSWLNSVISANAKDPGSEHSELGKDEAFYGSNSDDDWVDVDLG